MLTEAYLKQLCIEFIINYNRKSRADEEMERRTGEDTMKAQRDLMDRILLPLNIPYEQKEEIGSGDKISTRPVFQEVIEELKVGKYQAIAVKEMSRMGRGSYTDMGVIYDLIVDKRIFILTPSKVYDPQNSSDLRQIRFELFMSREEFETTRERLTGGRYNKAIEGRWMAGKPPFGYSLNRSTRKLEINEEEAQTVRIVFNLYAYGITDENGNLKDVGYRALCTYLKRININSPTGLTEWRTDNVKYLLMNPVYMGIMKYRATKTIDNKAVKRPESEHVIVIDAHPPIVDQETWDVTQQKVADKSHKPRVRLDYSPYELTGLIVCKECGRKMIRQYSEEKYTNKLGMTKTYEKEFLWCTTVGCTFVKYRNVEASVIKVLDYLSNLDLDIMELTLKGMASMKNNQNKMSEDIGQVKEKRIKELKARMKFIYEKYETGVYSDEMFIERKKEIDKELAQLELKSNDSSSYNSVSNEDKNVKTFLIKKELVSLANAYKDDSTDRGTKNHILRKVFDYVEVEIVEKGRGSIQAKHDINTVLNLKIFDHNSLVL